MVTYPTTTTVTNLSENLKTVVISMTTTIVISSMEVGGARLIDRLGSPKILRPNVVEDFG